MHHKETTKASLVKIDNTNMVKASTNIKPIYTKSIIKVITSTTIITLSFDFTCLWLSSVETVALTTYVSLECGRFFAFVYRVQENCSYA